MKTINKVTLLGNLGRDVEMRNTANGEAVANCQVATSSEWKDRDSGERDDVVHRGLLEAPLREQPERRLHQGVPHRRPPLLAAGGPFPPMHLAHTPDGSTDRGVEAVIGGTQCA